MRLERLLGWPSEPRTVADLQGRGYNFDPRRLRELVEREHWHHDDYRQPLPPEPPGEPVPGGTFQLAQALMRDYRFADGSAVHAIFEQDTPLEGRDMLLVARFAGLDFRLGVRVAGVVDEERVEDGRPVRVWGWCYRTLRGHLEAGQIEFRAEPAPEGLRFEIESWARSADRMSNLLYHRLRMAKEVQLHMWTSFLERVAKASGGRLTGGIDIDTRRVE